MDPQSQANEQRTNGAASLFRLAMVLAGLVLVLLAVREGSRVPGPYDPATAAPRAAVLWDWLELLVVPAALAVGAFLLNRAQKAAEDRRAAEARAQEKEIADDRRRQAQVEAYYDRMTALLFNDHVRERKERAIGDRDATKSHATGVAQALTAAVLRDLDLPRKNEVLRFLISIEALKDYNPLQVSLHGLDFSSVDLAGTDLSNTDLQGAILAGADLSGADLSNVKAYDADLSGARLTRANLSNARLERANLIGADLSGIAPDDVSITDAHRYRADLSGANLIEANLSAADLSGVFLNKALIIRANLAGANLFRANLSATELQHATLTGANLARTNLFQSNLSAADLSNADLSGAGMSESTLLAADLTGARLVNTELYAAKLYGTDLSGADLAGAKLDGAGYTPLTRWPDGFDAAAAGAIWVDPLEL